MSKSPPSTNMLNRDVNTPVKTQKESISVSTLSQSKIKLVSDEIKINKPVVKY